MKNIILFLTHFFNNYFPQILLIYFFMRGDNILASNIFLSCSFIVIIVNIFSSNKRSLIISNFSNRFVNDIIFFRFIFSIIIFLGILILKYSFVNISFLLGQFFLSILFRWIIEIILTKNELTNNIFKNIKYLIIELFFFIILFYNFFSKDIDFLIVPILSLNLIFLFFILIEIFKIKNISFNNFVKISILDLRSLSFVSSLFLSLSNQVWRLSIYFFVGPKVASIYYTCFALTSFFGTFMNNSIATYLVKKKINFIKLYYPIYIFLFLFIIIFIYFFINSLLRMEVNEITLFNHTLLISFLGTVLMIRSIYFRHILLIKKFQREVFVEDIKLYIIMIFTVPIFYYIGGPNSFKYLYFASSTLSLFVYFNLKSLKNVKNN